MTPNMSKRTSKYASRMKLTISEVIRDFALEIRHLFLAVLRVTEPLHWACRNVSKCVEVLFYIDGTFHVRGKTESSFKPTFKVNFHIGLDILVITPKKRVK